jgi:hypothetical protein
MLAIAVAASGWVLWTSPEPMKGSAAPALKLRPVGALQTLASGAPLEDELLTEATRGRTNPFARPAPWDDASTKAASSAQTYPPTLPTASPPTLEPPAPPAPPPPTLAGKMMSPNGDWVIYLRDGAVIASASLGLVLPSGYTVDRLEPKVAEGPPDRPSPREWSLRLTHPLRDEPVILRVQDGGSP